MLSIKSLQLPSRGRSSIGYTSSQVLMHGCCTYILASIDSDGSALSRRDLFYACHSVCQASAVAGGGRSLRHARRLFVASSLVPLSARRRPTVTLDVIPTATAASP